MMVLGVGTDIIEIDRVKKSAKNQRFMQRCFTSREIAILKNKSLESVAGMFAAKEAAVKALGTGFLGFWPNEIEIMYDEYSKPLIKLHGRAKEIAEQKSVSVMHLSISHCRDYAIAFVIAERI